MSDPIYKQLCAIGLKSKRTGIENIPEEEPPEPAYRYVFSLLLTTAILNVVVASLSAFMVAHKKADTPLMVVASINLGVVRNVSVFTQHTPHKIFSPQSGGCLAGNGAHGTSKQSFVHAFSLAYPRFSRWPKPRSSDDPRPRPLTYPFVASLTFVWFAQCFAMFAMIEHGEKAPASNIISKRRGRGGGGGGRGRGGKSDPSRIPLDDLIIPCAVMGLLAA
jgi:hypothetical protein